MKESFLTKWERVIKETRIPRDLGYAADDGAHENIPIGELVHTQAAEIDRLRALNAELVAALESLELVAALESLTKDPPRTLPREPDEDCEVIVKMRAIARAALSKATESK
jgi:hypothetical protein